MLLFLRIKDVDNIEFVILYHHREPELLPRVGDGYQAEIPALITGPENVNKVKENKKDEKLDFSTQSTDAPLIFGSVKQKSDACYGLVPGVCCDLWNDIEEASFLLGLYLFKKKFCPVDEIYWK
ncbi:hypothetical protein POM88_010845 [Heracleum sosnowskyi]|uniref:ELM2 domain-containing protein n=1 Tax=Heracleum sosnowskyi TaxID=360622 RepID=A0AAD8N0A2_9APIA|nr:hypothetical protein POM88_010845 [Heracleum sosnowskyi]